MKDLVGSSDIVMITLDTLRYDVAQAAFLDGELPGMASLLPATGWERRHSPASFTYAAHHAFLAGFLPTPLGPGPHPRRFAAEFAGSTSTVDQTFTFQESNLPEALAVRDYRTVCIGGTGFFNGRNALSRVLPGLFGEAYWSPEMGVTGRQSEVRQVDQALSVLGEAGSQRLFLLINVAALHQPNWFYLEGPSDEVDSLESHRAALRAVDRALIPLWAALRARGSAFVMLFADHGTAYGEGGYQGHRVGHEVVWTVPYAEFMLS